MQSQEGVPRRNLENYLHIRTWFLALLTFVAVSAFGQSGAVKSIKVRGNEHVSTDAILATMRTKVGQPFVEATLANDKGLIEAMGFFEAVDASAHMNDDQSGYDVTVDVHEYAVVKEIRLTGNKAIPSALIMKAIEVKTGEVFNRRQVAPSSDKIQELYTKKGLFAKVSDFGPLPDSRGTINVEIIELHVGEVKVNVASPVRTKKSVFNHLIKTKAGEAFSEQKWGDDLRRLYSTQWFETIKPTDTQPEAGTINLGVDLKEARTGNIGLGLQVDPQSSFAGFVKLSDSNFRGTGQSVGLDLLQSTSGGGPSVSLNYNNPFIDNRDTSFNFSLYSRLLFRFAGTGFGGNSTPTASDRYFERRTGGTFGFSRPIHGPRTVVGVSTRIESIKTNNLSTTTNDNFIQQDGLVAVFTAGLTRNRRDVDQDPSRGDYLQLSVDPGLSHITDIGGQVQNAGLLGTNYFLKSNLEYRFYYSPQKPRPLDKLDDPRRVFAFRARFGTISGNIPFFEQYFVGGVDTVRGYQDDRYWGRNQIITNFEYRHPLQKSFNLLFFVDYGGAWAGYSGVNAFTQSDRPKMHLGYGPGLSFKTPLGPIRLDLGFNEHGKTRIDFQIGTSF